MKTADETFVGSGLFLYAGIAPSIRFSWSSGIYGVAAMERTRRQSQYYTKVQRPYVYFSYSANIF